ncbi:hypothetical protein VNI00_005302 [Paramarasmius palmivorus]|uniref:Cytochrome P450 n=1 Tax=Paramarasmius palmivorus TaxID=297713 RepID=A0AAW0DFP3_9AGAR
MPYGETWRRHRRLFHEGFRDSAMGEMLPVLSQKVEQFLSNIALEPADFRAHIRTFAAATIMGVTYGHDVASTNDYFVDLAEKAISSLVSLSSPSSAVVNLFPFLRHLPPWIPGLSYYRRVSDQSHQWIDDMVHKPYELVIDGIKSGTKNSSILAKLLARHEAKGGRDEEELQSIKHICAGAYGAGADTMASVLTSFFVAMMTHPQVQEKAREEIDRVVGRERLPTYADRPNLPYIESILREVLRRYPITPLGVFRRNVKADMVDGFFIPEGTAVIGNTWAMTRDEDVYPEPESFVPERFMTKNGTCNDDDLSFIFGFGRRICPGRHLALASLWGAIASVLAVFDITKAKDENGNDVIFNVVYSDAMVHFPVTLCQDRIKQEGAETRTLFVVDV